MTLCGGQSWDDNTKIIAFNIKKSYFKFEIKFQFMSTCETRFKKIPREKLVLLQRKIGVIFVPTLNIMKSFTSCHKETNLNVFSEIPSLKV